MKKFYAALLAAAMLTAGAGVSVQAQDMGGEILENVGGITTDTGFNVWGTGNMEANSGTFHGDVTASGSVIGNSGKFENGLTAGNDKFHVWSSGSMEAASGRFTGNVTANSFSGASGEFTGDISAAGGKFNVWGATGGVSAADGKFTIDGYTGAVNGTDGTFSGALTAANGEFSGALTAANGKFSVDKETGTITTAGGINAAGGKFTVDEATGAVKGTDGHFSGDVYVANRTEGVGASLAAHDTMIAENKANILNNSNRISALSNKVSDLGGEIDSVGAISSALAGLHPLDYDGTGSKFQLAAAMGNYDGTQAAAIGGFYHFNEDVMMSLGGATSFGGDNKSAFNVGVTFRVGEGGGHKAVPADVQERLDAQEAEIAALKAQVEALLAKDAQ